MCTRNGVEGIVACEEGGGDRGRVSLVVGKGKIRKGPEEVSRVNIRDDKLGFGSEEVTLAGGDELGV